MKHGIKKQKTAADILEINLLLRLAKSKRKRIFAQSLTITEPRNFLRLELEITGEEMGLESRVFKKKNLISPANRKTRMLFLSREEKLDKSRLEKVVFFR